MKKEIIRINNLSYKVKDGDEEKMLLIILASHLRCRRLLPYQDHQVPEKQHFYMQFQGC